MSEGCERSGYQYDRVSSCGVPCGALESLGKEQPERLWGAQVSASEMLVAGRVAAAGTDNGVSATRSGIDPQATQVHFVGMRDGGDAPGRKADRVRQPQEIVFWRDGVAIFQHAQEAPLERRSGDECTVQVEECRNPASGGAVHAASCAGFLPRRERHTLPATCPQPSTSTGSPRTRQNAAVVQVSR